MIDGSGNPTSRNSVPQPGASFRVFASKPPLAYGVAALPPLFWAGNFLIARIMRDTIPPFQMSFWRWMIAFLLILPFALGRSASVGERIRQEWPFLALLGLVGVTAFNCFVYSALQSTTVVNAALINSLMPVVTFVFAIVLLRERLTLRQMVGIALSVSGAAVVIARGDLELLLAFSFNHGELLVLAGLTFWAAYTVLIKWRPTRLPLTVFLASTFAFGALFHLPLIAWEMRTVGGFALSFETAGSILFFALFPSVLAYVLWNRAVAVLGPSRTGVFMYLMPIFSAMLGVGFLGEPFVSYHLAGIVLIFGGIGLVTGGMARR